MVLQKSRANELWTGSNIGEWTVLKLLWVVQLDVLGLLVLISEEDADHGALGVKADSKVAGLVGNTKLGKRGGVREVPEEDLTINRGRYEPIVRG